MKVANIKARNQIFLANYFKNPRKNYNKIDHKFGKLKLPSNFINDDDNEVNKSDGTKHPVSFVEMRLRK
jgi:hypothetical protein